MRLSQLLNDFVEVKHQILKDEDFLEYMEDMPSNGNASAKTRLEQNKTKLAAIGKVIDDLTEVPAPTCIRCMTFGGR